MTPLLMFALIFLVGTSQGGSYEASDGYLEWVANWEEVIRALREDSALRHDAERLYNKARPKPRVPSIPFECEPQEPGPTPTSVHMLRPVDIDLVAALGDSITAGHGPGANNLIEVAFQNRGLVWSIGGDESLEEGVITLTNILRNFNPDIRGYSRCLSYPGSGRTGFNVASPGATNRDMPDQAVELVERLKNDSSVDLVNTWKLVTMLVGGNDLCGYCRNNDGNSPETYVANFRIALDYLKEHLPRSFVNVKVMMDTTYVYNLTDGQFCDFMHQQFCSCVMEPESRSEMREVQLGYYYGLRELIDSGRYDEADDFTVVLQPHLRDQEPFIDPDTGNYDMSFVSPDCFHPSEVAHQGFAFMMWNMMMTPLGQKPYAYDDEDYPTYVCPTQEHPYFFTSKNSGLVVPTTPAGSASARVEPVMMAAVVIGFVMMLLL